jgi:hypothetical protein
MADFKDKPIVLVVVSDLHAGSTVGVCPPRVELDDGGDYKASKAQKWLWQNWLDFCGKVEAKVGALDANLVVVFNGDCVEGNHHSTLQTITANSTTQIKIAQKVMAPLVNIADDVFIVRGTPAHVGESAKYEEHLADDLTNVVRESKHAASHWHLPLSIKGTVFDIAHHGSLGRLPWTRPNSVNKIAAAMIIDSHQRGAQVPNVVIRSHLHQYADTGNNYSKIRVIATPAWQLPTGYVNKIQPGAIADIGGLIFTCWRNHYEVDIERYAPKPKQPIMVAYE